jgi:Do/DeqQ family serine protease
MNPQRFENRRWLGRAWQVGRPIIAGFLMIMLIALAVSGWSPVKSLAQLVDKPKLSLGASTPAQPAALVLPTEPNAIADIVDVAGQAVVKIQTKSVQNVSDPFMNDPFFRQFFGGSTSSPQRVVQGLGSGFIISADGYILTNDHVVEDAGQIQVTVMGHSEPLTAKVVGSDSDLDLAVLKIDNSGNLPYLQFGSSDSLRVGEWVIAIGNPYGLDHTVTVGVISAKGRPVSIENRNYRNLLQTDASINPGNSGGPLLNLAGQVVGVNTAVNASAQGIGFAIPSSTVQGVIDQLISSKTIPHPFMGVSVSEVTSEIAQSLGLDSASGAVVREVVAGSPAQQAGIKAGDVILAIDQAQIQTPDDVVEQIASYNVGDQVNVKIMRQGSTMDIKVTLVQKGSS